MKLSIDIPNEVLAASIRDVILEKGLLQDAVARCFVEGRVGEKISAVLVDKIESLLTSVVDGKRVVESVELAVGDAIAEAVARTMEMVGQERIAEMVRSQIKGIEKEKG